LDLDRDRARAAASIILGRMRRGTVATGEKNRKVVGNGC
jgi:hypothetical protein